MAAGLRRRGRKRRAHGIQGLMLAALAATLAASARAEPGPETPGPPAAVSEAARRVLETYCAECRARHAASGTLDLDALARDDRLVVPHDADASRAYQRLLAAEALSLRARTAHGDKRPANGNRNGASDKDKNDKDDTASATPSADPSPAEIEAVRDWIESLPIRDTTCTGRPRVTPEDVERLIDAWLETVGPAEAADTRFLSLVHLWNACTDPAALAAYRTSAETLLSALARRRDTVALETLGDESALLVVRLSALPLQPAEWERLARAAPVPGAEAIPADWLAAYVVSRPKDAAGAPDPAFDVRLDGAAHEAISALARSWETDVGLARAAAERGAAPEALAAGLAALGGDHIQAAMRLVRESVPRATWSNLASALDGAATAPTPWMRTLPEDEIDVLLWTDKLAYRPRDLVTARVSVSRACHLTLISVDGDGRAIVLFPSELEQDNLVAPSVVVSVPGRDAGYQLRFEKAGEEKLVAVCQRAAPRLAGIAYDYERQRFAILGDWRAFLRSVPEREREIRAREASQAARRRRRGRSPPPTPETPAVGAEDAVPAEGRAAITVMIAPYAP